MKKISIIIVVLLVAVGAGFYFWQKNQTQTPASPNPSDAPVITSISPTSGPVGTAIDVLGKNLAGFEGDLNLWFENSAGVKGILYADSRLDITHIRATLPEKLCQKDNSYSGAPCDAWLELVPGVYNVYTEPWGKKSNVVQFTVTDQTVGWKTYHDSANGFSFQYPESFNSKYASLQSIPPKVVVSSSKTSINENGCYAIPNSPMPQKDSQITTNRMNFCLSESSDVGAGQLYTDYYYTVFKNAMYVTVDYTIHTPNGCSAYIGVEPQYTECSDFLKNHYTDLVLQPIQKSISTLNFTK